jgi:hypothetical protein
MSTTTLELPQNAAREFGNPGLRTAEVEAFHRDDAMASGMIAVILGCAFLVLLTLTIGVTIWTMTVAT